MSDQNREPVEITGEEFNNWKSSHVTQLVIGEIIITSEDLKNYLASGATLAKDADESTDRIVGRIEGLSYLFRMFNSAQESYQKEVNQYDH